MAQYIKSTDFALKDSLITGDPLKIVSGTEINDEFNAIQVAVNSKADLNSPTLTGTPLAPTAAAGTNTTQVATTAFVQQNSVPAGAVFYFAASSAPTGYLICNGSAVSRSTYAALFAIVGTTFGAGDGSTTFNLPDLRGQFIRGIDNGRGVDTGRVFGSSQNDAVTEHNHYLSCTSAQTPAFTDDGPSTFHGGHRLTNRMAIGDGGYTTGSKYLGSSNQTSRGNMGVDKVNKFLTGSNTTTTTETRPKNVALLPCIKI